MTCRRQRTMGLAIGAAALAMCTSAALAQTGSAGATSTVLGSESETDATAQQFRHYRSYGRLPDAPDPRISRPRSYGPGPATRAPVNGDFLAPRRDLARDADTRGDTDTDPASRECAARYRSFNKTTGNYLTPSGQVRRCPVLD